MYQGKNPTALQSQNLITEALLALMEEEPFQKITINRYYNNSFTAFGIIPFYNVA